MLRSLTQRSGTPTVANAVTSGTLRFGGQVGTTNYRFTGQLDDVEFFDGTFSPAHINALYAAASPCAPVTVLLASPVPNTTYAAPATIDLVAGASSQYYVSRVEFYNGATLIATAGGPPFEGSWTNVPPGTYTLTAKAIDVSGASATSNPITVTVIAVNGNSTVTVGMPAPGSTYYSASPVHFRPTATPAEGYSIFEVVYYANGQVIGWTKTSPFDFTWRNPTPGTYSIVLKVVDNAGLVTTSAPFTITVVAGEPAVVYYYNDAAGTPFAAADQYGTLLWNETYAPYGERYSHEDTGTQNGLWYTGKPVEDSTGLSYYGGRWYNPSIGRFYSVDPQRFKEEAPLSFNRYAYGNNNPYRFVDPDGRESEETTTRLGDNAPAFANSVASFARGMSDLADSVSAAVMAAPKEAAMWFAGGALFKGGIAAIGALGVKRAAMLGATASADYRATFFTAYPELRGEVTVHHAVEQQVLTRYPGLFTESEINSLQNLRGIPNSMNSELHLSQIRRSWNEFYRQSSNPTREQVLQKAGEIDQRFGAQFTPSAD